MDLELSVLVQAGDEIDKVTIKQTSATIGRDEDSTIVLIDPRRYISGHHADITYQAPDYFITDTSTNGVLINNATMSVGKGNRVQLNNQDKLHIGSYTLIVKITGEQQPTELPSPSISDALSLNFSSHSAINEPLSDQSLSFENDPFADLGTDSVQSMIDENQLIPDTEDKVTSDPFKDIDTPSFDDRYTDIVNAIPRPSIAIKEAFEPFKAATQSKKEPVIDTSDMFSDDWFQKDKKQPSKELFPDDYFSDNKEEIKPEKEEEALKVTKQLGKPDKTNKTKKNKKTNKSDKENKTDKNNKTSKTNKKNKPTLPVIPINDPTSSEIKKQLIGQFLLGAGLEDTTIDEVLTPESFYIIGKILRASVQGAMDVLIGRAKIKNEMHLDVTTIRSVENNPVKFSVTAEEAIKKLLAPQDKGYLQAEEAIEEAFDDIRAHQFSVISGMQTALFEVLKRFDPQKLEQRLQKQSPLSASIPIHKQAKLWRLFEQLYDAIENEASDNFYDLFGQAFAESYEEQMILLKNSKKDRPF